LGVPQGHIQEAYISVGLVARPAADEGQRGAGNREQHGEHRSSLKPELNRCHPDEARQAKTAVRPWPWRPFHLGLTAKTEVSMLQLLAAIANAGGHACVASFGSWP
jgi:hypothetical protein